MQELIKDIMNLSQASNKDIKREWVEMDVLAKTIVLELQNSQPERKSEITINGDLTVWGDKGLIEVLLTNLIGNAWKFAGKKEIARIQFGSFRENGAASTFYIRDNGAGFDMAKTDKLFKPFQRLHSRDDFEGTGIGLATVHRIVNRHGGKIWVETAINKGTTFYFSLPLKL